MTEVLLPTWIVPEEETQEWLDEGSSVFGAAFAPGIAQRQSYGGLRLKLSRRHTVRGEEKAQLLAILNQTRGRFIALRTKVHFALRGSGFGTELLSNNTFQNGTTGWSSGSAANITISAQDRVLRSLRVSALSSTTIRASATTTVAFAPYVARAYIVNGRGAIAPHGARLGTTAGGNDVATTGVLTASGLSTSAGVAQGTATHFSILDSVTGRAAGDFIDIPYASTSGPALVDNGLNLVTRSDEFDNAAWTKTFSTISANAATAPDGTTTADSIIEDSSTNVHRVDRDVTVSSAAGDYSFGIAMKAGARTWARLAMEEATGGTIALAFFNLNTGAVGTTSVGANWSNIRTFVAPLGDGWFGCFIVARKTNAATTITPRIALASADNTASYAGDGTSNILAWRATPVQSGVPTRLIQTTTTASTGTSQTGNALHVKGLPASTDGLLLPGDYFEINGEIKQATAALNSDAAGLGYLQFEPALVRSPANDDPIIVTDPMGKFLVSNIKVENQFGTQAVVTYDLEHIYE